MPRKERELDDSDDPLVVFARDLRELREGAGRPPYRELAGRAHFSAAALCDAAGGRRLPSLPVTTAYVRACGGRVEDWEHRWRHLDAELRAAGPPRQAPPPSVVRLFTGVVGGLLVRVGAAMMKSAQVRRPELAERNLSGHLTAAPE
ncbi:helix-turn-helix domain-containing protein [Saccharothrix sp. 6-C]|uniref:helix-turn-helix domain-containing protein n=1 Tax=Saccharothrix sp. 6-C TaxID=2781735 RepID=UPI0019178888|nr:helix-turn-helix domain-containing protein [Saccharothrix sp. 6-C]QQQ78014.1 helix-turn-helix domain-containing protein [Saccharothrix sp. 6-C]